MYAQMERGVHMWEQRDQAAAHVLALAPTPALPCPTWCSLEPGHAWDNYDDGRLTRFHERHLSPEGRDGYAEVMLLRIDELLLDSGAEQVSTASHLDVVVHGNGSGAPTLTSLQAREVASVLLDAARLLAEATAAGDPAMGTDDEEWESRSSTLQQERSDARVQITSEVEAALEWAETPEAQALALAAKAATTRDATYSSAARALAEESDR